MRRLRAHFGRSPETVRQQGGRSYWRVMYVACEAALVVHALFTVLFIALGLGGMIALNAFSILVNALALVFLRARLNRLALLCAWLEVIVYAAVAVRLLGLESGFQYYMFVVMPLTFVAPQSRGIASKIFVGSIVAGIYLALDVSMHESLPVYEVSDGVLDLLRLFNIATTFAVLAGVAHIYFSTMLRAEARLRKMASTDPLTGALNRRFLTGEMNARIANAEVLSFVIGDIDHFKRVNDLHGHDGGDQVLISVHAVLQSNKRPDDLVGRWGGEEFMLLLPGADVIAAVAVAERLRAAVEGMVVEGLDSDLRVSMTFGAACLRAGESSRACIARADEALYRGKSAGRNRVVAAE